MKMPKKVKKFCPKCNKPTEQKISQVKTGKKRGALKVGARKFEEKRKGYTSFPRPKPEKSKRWGVKLTKKLDLRYTCKDCKKTHVRKRGFRAKKVEWEAAR